MNRTLRDGARGRIAAASRGAGRRCRRGDQPGCAILAGVSEAVRVAEALIEVFPRQDAVAAVRDDQLLARLEQLEELAWPDFDGAMVGSTPSARNEWKGVDGLVAAWADWLQPFDSHRTEIEEMREAGNDCVVILLRQIARPKGATADVENMGAAVVWTRDGKLSRIEFHIDRTVAIRAAGLTE
jgi:SnoaL-like protein